MLRFCFRLAGHLGKTVAQLFEELGSIDELYYWLAFYNIEPYGDEWRQTAMQCQATVAPHTKKKTKAEDWMPIQQHQDHDAILNNLLH